MQRGTSSHLLLAEEVITDGLTAQRWDKGRLSKCMAGLQGPGKVEFLSHV